MSSGLARPHTNAAGGVAGNVTPGAVGSRVAQTFVATISPGDPVAVSGTWVNTGTALGLSH